ncbi:MAG: ADP-ribose pyrophosphatase [Ignavibacteriales bacterium CG18_big_fil_WC_8_21_14_2_50_31_20]|nr:MAG: ADP-ribose pyrophosphatase [Ignavibacteriales bacterium CG18_big_fil_WC_8_21_14_2_50_31_20]
MNYKVTKSENVFNGIVFDVKLDILEYDSGNAGRREVIHHNGGSVILPITNDGKLVLIKQFRYPLQEILIEAPAGKLEIGEDPMVCATRELTEETGYTAKKITPLGKISTTPGFCDEILYLYLAQDLTAGDHDREEGEFGMEIFEYTLHEVDEMIKNGKIIDSKTIAVIYHYKSFYLSND